MSRHIIEVARIADPAAIHIAVAPGWQFDAHNLARESEVDNLVGELMQREEFRERGEDAATFAKDLQSRRDELRPVLTPDRESSSLERAAWLIENEFGASVNVVSAEQVTRDFSRKARPGRPAIQIE